MKHACFSSLQAHDHCHCISMTPTGHSKIGTLDISSIARRTKVLSIKSFEARNRDRCGRYTSPRKHRLGSSQDLSLSLSVSDPRMSPGPRSTETLYSQSLTLSTIQTPRTEMHASILERKMQESMYLGQIEEVNAVIVQEKKARGCCPGRGCLSRTNLTWSPGLTGSHNTSCSRSDIREA